MRALEPVGDRNPREHEFTVPSLVRRRQVGVADRRPCTRRVGVRATRVNALDKVADAYGDPAYRYQVSVSVGGKPRRRSGLAAALQQNL